MFYLHFPVLALYSIICAFNQVGLHSIVDTTVCKAASHITLYTISDIYIYLYNELYVHFILNN